MIIRPFEMPDTAAVVALWQEVGLTRPWNDPHADIRRKLTVQPELFLVAADHGAILGSVMGGYDGLGYERFEVGNTGKRLIPDG